jgi:hypothetical protein
MLIKKKKRNRDNEYQDCERRVCVMSGFLSSDLAPKYNVGIGQCPIENLWTIGTELIGLVHSKSNSKWTKSIS